VTLNDPPNELDHHPLWLSSAVKRITSNMQRGVIWVFVGLADSRGQSSDVCTCRQLLVAPWLGERNLVVVPSPSALIFMDLSDGCAAKAL